MVSRDVYYSNHPEAKARDEMRDALYKSISDARKAISRYYDNLDNEIIDSVLDSTIIIKFFDFINTADWVSDSIEGTRSTICKIFANKADTILDDIKAINALISERNFVEAESKVNNITEQVKKLFIDVINGVMKTVNKTVDEEIKKQPLPTTEKSAEVTPLKKVENYADIFKSKGCPAEVIGPSKLSADCYILAIKNNGKVRKFLADPMGVFANEMPKIIEIGEQGDLEEGIHENDIPRLDTPKDINSVLIKSFLDLMKFGVSMTDAKTIKYNRQIYGIVKNKEWGEYVQSLVPGKDIITIAIIDNKVTFLINNTPKIHIGMERNATPKWILATADNGQTPVATKLATTVKESVFSDEEKAEIMKALNC